MIEDEFATEGAVWGDTWKDIKSADDYFSWLRGPVRDLLFAGDANVGCGKAARANPGRVGSSLAPTMCSVGSNRDGKNHQYSQVWWMVGCYIRQVRVKPKSIKGTALEGVNIPLTEIYPDFTEEEQDTSIRSWKNGTVKEGWMGDDFVNEYFITKGSPRYRGSPLLGQIHYPGQSGQVFGGDFTSARAGPEQNYPGYWMGINSPVPNGSRWDADLNTMEESWWIDEQTRLVQLGCRGTNANTNQRFLALYSLEIGASGIVYPTEPEISTELLNRDNEHTWKSVTVLLVFFFYYLNEEIYEMSTLSLSDYFMTCGWLNLLDWFGIATSLGSYIMLCDLVGRRPSQYPFAHFGDGAHRQGFWSQMQTQQTLQLMLATTLFFLWFKALKFAQNVPIMSTIGTTFSRAVTEILMFACVMGALFMAFGMWFHVMLCTKVPAFGTFEGAMQQVVLNGLMGELSADEISKHLPTLGPLFYSMYIFSVLFVGFTILIAMIADRYEAAKEEEHSKEGFVALGLHWMSHKLFSNKGDNVVAVDGEDATEIRSHRDLLSSSTQISFDGPEANAVYDHEADKPGTADKLNKADKGEVVSSDGKLLLSVLSKLDHLVAKVDRMDQEVARLSAGTQQQRGGGERLVGEHTPVV